MLAPLHECRAHLKFATVTLQFGEVQFGSEAAGRDSLQSARSSQVNTS